MATIALLDRNALSNIQAGNGVSDDDRARLRVAIRDGRLSIPLSITMVEETLARTLTDPAMAIMDLRWVIDFSGEMRLIKPSGDLLNEYIRAYAQERAPDPYSSVNLARTLGFSREDIPELRRAAHQARLDREAFVKTNASVQDLLRRPGIVKDARRSFPEYYEAFAEDCVVGFARRAYVLEACQVRGLSDLLGVKLVRNAVGITLSYLYAQTFERDGARRQDIGDISPRRGCGACRHIRH
jgi:hypothetical protein